MRVTCGRARYCKEPPDPAGGGSTLIYALDNEDVNLILDFCVIRKSTTRLDSNRLNAYVISEIWIDFVVSLCLLILAQCKCR